MCRCEYELDTAACLGRRSTPTREEARGAFLASRHPCDSCVIGSRRAREDAERRISERMRIPAVRTVTRTPSKPRTFGPVSAGTGTSRKSIGTEGN